MTLRSPDPPPFERGAPGSNRLHGGRAATDARPTPSPPEEGRRLGRGGTVGEPGGGALLRLGLRDRQRHARPADPRGRPAVPAGDTRLRRQGAGAAVRRRDPPRTPRGPPG